MLKDSIKYLFLILIFLALYTFRLDKVPVHLNQDELMFALNAKSIAESGADYYSNILPFYFWHLDNFWATPVIVYFSSLSLNFLPVSEVFIRLPSVFFGLINVILVIILVKKTFGNSRFTLFAELLLVTTPAFFINSRLLLDNIYILPFVLLWLIFLEKNPFLSGLSLGVGIHSYHAAKIYMPLYLIASLVYFVLSKQKKRVLKLILGFAIPVILFLPWLKNHPDTLTNQISYASSIDKNLGSNFIKNYFSYFDPKVLFIEGDRTLIHSTGKVGVFLFPVVFLLVFGILYCFRQKDYFSKLIIAGFLTYPVAPALINDPGRISRALVVIPFVILLSVYGIKFLLEQKDKVFKYLLILISVLSIFQFGVFLSDYFENYRARSYGVFNSNIGGALESALKSTRIREVETIYLDKYIPYVDFYYRFYQMKLGITFGNIKGYDFRKDSFAALPARSLVVSGRKIAGNDPIEIIREPDGSESYFVYEKTD